MKLSALLHEVESNTVTAQEVEITGITDQSSDVKKGTLFVCVPGTHVDGHAYAAQAAQNGAAALVTKRLLQVDLPQIVVENPRKAYAQLCGNFFGNPARSMQLIGITGTNGKTTTAWMLRHILTQCGQKTGLIGTIPEKNTSMQEVAHYTTPAPPQLHATLRELAEGGVRNTVMEASSQALWQQRLAGLHFTCGVFTNLSPEHLDYHPDMEDYYRAKRSLFDVCDRAVIFTDTPWGGRLAREMPCPGVTVSTCCPAADYVIGSPVCTERDTEVTVRNNGVEWTLLLPMIGTYNIQNAVCAAAAAVECGIPLRYALNALEQTPPIPGRMERLPLETPFEVYIDYAHTPEALEQALTALRRVCRGRLICVFGCGGDRDRTKRPRMGEIAGRLCHRTILTNDNPRTEDPDRILDEIEAGVSRSNYDRIPDRATAIETAIARAQPGDLILIAGKGHEQYQILEDGCHPFNEHIIAAEAARHWKKERNVQKWNR